MELAAAKKRIAELSKELEAHNYRYYVLNDPTVSDFSYDEMMRELRELEAAFPSLQLPTSPTQRVGGVASSTFEKVQHAVQMMRSFPRSRTPIRSRACRMSFRLQKYRRF